jgi:ribose transport system substrate-binding protein
MMRNSGNSRSSTVQAVVRACGIIRAFRHEGEELLLSDVMERTSLRRTTAFRLLQSLVSGGMLERTARGVYRCPFPPAPGNRFRLGYAAQTDSEFARDVNESLQRVAARERVDLVMVNNRYSVKEALRNADLLVEKRVDLVLEFQTYERVAAVISSKFLEARIPVIAIEIPHPGAVYFGANNYQAGVIGGRALGRWAKEQWSGAVEQVLLIGLPIAGPLPALRITGIQDGLRAELPRIGEALTAHLDGKGDFEQILGVVRRWLRRNSPRRTLVGTVNDMCALAALRAFEEAGAGKLCAVVGQNATREARNELRRPGTRLIGTVAYFPERYGDELIPMALNMLEHKPVPPATFVKHQLLTAKNVDLVYPLDRPSGAMSTKA